MRMKQTEIVRAEISVRAGEYDSVAFATIAVNLNRGYSIVDLNKDDEGNIIVVLEKSEVIGNETIRGSGNGLLQEDRADGQAGEDGSEA